MALQWIHYLLHRGLMMMLRYKKFKKQLEFCSEYRGVPADRWHPTNFNQFTAWFIKYTGTKAGFGLAPYLDYSNHIDNHLAVALWLDLKMKSTQWAFFSLSELRNSLKHNVPDDFFFN